MTTERSSIRPAMRGSKPVSTNRGRSGAEGSAGLLTGSPLEAEQCRTRHPALPAPKLCACGDPVRTRSGSKTCGKRECQKALREAQERPATEPLAPDAPGTDAWCRNHGIDPTVWAARGVFRYTTAENEKVKQVFEKFPTISPATVTRTVRQSGGLVMLKHAAPGYGPIPAQLRPDNPVLMNSKKQYHFHGPGKCPVSDFPSSAWVSKDGNKKRLRELIVTGSAATEHINKSKSKEPYDPETGFGEHHGDNREGVHFHLELAKYVLFGKGISKRIDVHPWSLPRIPGADRVFFALEGVLKADAILSAGEAVFDVPSVTVWNPAELKRFAGEYLREKVVFIVPDADGVNNLQVERQAFYIRTLLRNAGIQAEIASPPYALYLADSDLKGVDDFLGRGYAIDDLSVLRKEVPADRIYAWGLEPRGLRSDRVRRAVRALEGLSLHASDVATPDAPVGTLDAPMGTLSKIMGGIRKRALVDTLTDLRDALLVEGSLETETKMWDGNPVFDWVERPSIQVRPQFQAIVQDPQPLGAFWMNYTAAHVLVERQWLERIEKKLDARLHEEADKSKTERHLRVVPPLEIQETAV